ncbi:MAG: serine/threonine protein kinase [Planctomycetes bacterium]|nr:serine/threonine protein kinase [Planctomycetota bacterium]
MSSASGLQSTTGSTPKLELPRVAGYTLVEMLNEGSVCTLYKARQERMGRTVALKLLPEWPPPREVTLERFNRSTYVLAQVVHPNLPVLYDTGTSDGFHYAALEYIGGRTLQDMLSERGTFSERRAAAIALQIARALAALQQKGIVHRNLKPRNVMVEPDGRVRLVGLGLAKCEAACFAKHLDEHTIGTPHFMAPEMIRGNCNDPRSDFYALGVTMYVMAAGHPPFEKGVPAAVMAKHLYEEPQPLRALRPEFSETYEKLTMHLLKKCPDDRLADPKDVARRLEHLVSLQDYSSEKPGNAEAKPHPLAALAPHAAKPGPAAKPRASAPRFWNAASHADWDRFFRNFGIFSAAATAVLLLGLACLGAYALLSGRLAAAPQPEPHLRQAAPAAPAASSPLDARARALADYQALKGREAAFLRDPAAGAQAWNAFLNEHGAQEPDLRALADDQRARFAGQAKLSRTATQVPFEDEF